MGDMADFDIEQGLDSLYSDETCEHGYDAQCPECDKEEQKKKPRALGRTKKESKK